MKKEYSIQGLTFEPKITEEVFSVQSYKDSKQFINLFETYLSDETQIELDEITKYSENLLKLTEGISIEELSKGNEETTKLMLENLSKHPEGLKALTGLQEYQLKIESAREDFLLLNSKIKNQSGKPVLISNFRLLLDTFLKGDVSKINLTPEKTSDTLELIDFGNEILRDFFLSIRKSNCKLKISDLTLKAMNLETNLT